jgi:hypothetical protein
MAASSSIKITYFPIQGAAEAARLALTIGGVAFEDERVPPEVWKGEGGAAIKAKSPFGQASCVARLNQLWRAQILNPPVFLF